MNAGRYEGPGPGGWMGAAGAWTGMAVNAAAALGTFFAQKSDLAAQVFGVSSAAQLTAAAGYGGWLGIMHGLADGQALALQGAAAAYSQGKTTMVPLEAVLANRSAYAAAVSSSILGPADPTAVALQVQYGQMHAENAATMMGYDTAATTATLYKPSPPPPPLVTAMPGSQSAETAAQTAQELSAKNAAGKPADMMTKMLPMALQALPQAAQMPAQFVQMMSSQLGQAFQPVQQIMSQMVSPLAGALGNGLGTGGAGLGSTPAQTRGGAPVRGGLPLGSGTGAMGGLGSRLATGGAGGLTGELPKPTSTAVRTGPSFTGIPLEKMAGTTLSSGAGAGGMGGAVPPRRHRDKTDSGAEYQGGEHVYRAKSRDGQNENLSNPEEDALFD
ncbi:PPE domain-containing protein [Mycolicibacterium wolinskyi]|nr:PPE domain-containing protein [Mycolicibacterium wolinskyi]MCV7296208.1 PPE domain-containing protein [Mycolicibacterium goodii]